MVTQCLWELRVRFSSYQFLLLVTVAVVLFALNGVLYAGRYRRLVDSYQLNVTKLREQPSTRKTYAYRAPSRVAFVADGGERTNPPGYTVKPKSVVEPLHPVPANNRLPDVPDIDWAFIVKVVFGLYVILLSFDAISGDREQGTLRLTLANKVSRLQTVAAKYVAILGSVVAALFVGATASLAVVLTMVPGAMGLEQMILVIVMLGLSVLYLSLFTLAGLLVSTLIRQPSLGLLGLLVVWILGAILVPNTAAILADGFSVGPREYQVAQAVRGIVKESIWRDIDGIKVRAKAGAFATDEEVVSAADEVFARWQARLVQEYDAYFARTRRRMRLARGLARVSPAALYQFGMQAVAGTGPARDQRFLSNVRMYSGQYDAYIRDKVGELIAVAPFSFATTVAFGDHKVRLRSPAPLEYEGDKSDFPFFEDREPTAVSGLRDAGLDVLGLLLWNVALGLMAGAAMLRADVR